MDADEIGSLSHRQSQEECRKTDLSGKNLSQNNNSKEEQEEAPVNKRHRAVTDDLICPITHELPFDPVTAEDGRIYERSAIEQHFRTHRGITLKSPVTNERMGQLLLPSPQIRSLIETLIETRSVEGDLRDAWKRKEKEKKFMNELLAKASGGDVSAMHSVFRNYRKGKNGFPEDFRLAYKWVQKAHAAGSVKATACLGKYLLSGKVGDHRVRMNKTQGIVLITMAAERGSNNAAYHLGSAFADGEHGLAVDNGQAAYWLQRSLSDDLPYKHLPEAACEKVQAKLQEVLNRSDDSPESDSSSEISTT